MKKKISALNYSLKLLGYRGRSEKELIKRLSMKGYNDSEIRDAVKRLQDMGLIDDRRLAIDFRNYAEINKKLGAAGTRNFLLSRGIPGELIEEACKDIDEESTVIKLVEKRVRDIKDEGEKRRIYSLLQRKGYSYQTIRKVIKNLFNEEVS